MQDGNIREQSRGGGNTKYNSVGCKVYFLRKSPMPLLVTDELKE